MKKTKLRNFPSPPNTNCPSKRDNEIEEEHDVEEETKEAEHDEEAYILQFPDHIILEIFCRMTTSTILRCRFVCKSWLYLLSDPYFTRSLFLRTPHKPHLASPSRLWVLATAASACMILGVAGHSLHLANPITSESLVLPQHDTLFPFGEALGIMYTLLGMDMGFILMAFFIGLGTFLIGSVHLMLNASVSNTSHHRCVLLKDYGAKESWVKEFEIVNAFDQHIPHVLKFAEEGQVLMVHNYQLKAYTPRKMGFSRFEVDGLPVMVESGCTHIPSFVSLTDIIRG
ncbi:hypothetical protein M0R45_020230 [Rubus argutus]|uniref:F-box domain-containing protein n=1 Tax=Rubus argutus TaxID=59490 RepID=A0AAW1X7Q3_RUBAR